MLCLSAVQKTKNPQYATMCWQRKKFVWKALGTPIIGVKIMNEPDNNDNHYHLQQKCNQLLLLDKMILLDMELLLCLIKRGAQNLTARIRARDFARILSLLKSYN